MSTGDKFVIGAGIAYLVLALCYVWGTYGVYSWHKFKRPK